MRTVSEPELHAVTRPFLTQPSHDLEESGRGAGRAGVILRRR